MDMHHGVQYLFTHTEVSLGKAMDHIHNAVMLMMVTTGGWFSGLSETTRNFIAVTTILGFGFTLGAAFIGFTTLPDKVSANTVRSEQIATSLEEIRDRVDDFDDDINYLVALSKWTMCAIRIHDDANSGTAALLQICGPEPVVR